MTSHKCGASFKAKRMVSYLFNPSLEQLNTTICYISEEVNLVKVIHLLMLSKNLIQSVVAMVAFKIWVQTRPKT